MQWLHRWLGVIALASVSGLPLAAESFKDTNGVVHAGSVISYNGSGVVMRLDSGKISTRMPYAQFTQDALKEMAKNPTARTFVELLIEPEPGKDGEENEAPIAQEVLKPPAWKAPDNTVKLPATVGVFSGLFKSGPGWLVILVVWGANIFAGFHIGMYRRQSRWLVPGVSAAAPFIGPIVFLFLPPAKTEEKESAADAAGKEDKKPAAKAVVKGAGKAGAAHKPVVTAKPAAGHAAAAAAAPEAPAPIAAPAKPATKALEAAAYVKGEVNINKRFIETKFAPFFKLLPDEPYRSAWIYIVTPRAEYWAKRIPAISQTDVTFQCPQENGGTMDEVLQIAEIKEMHLRPPE